MPEKLVRVCLSVLLVLGTACSSSSSTASAPVSVQTPARDPDVPPLPFADNPDPNACGIPSPVGDFAGWVSGVYQGEVLQPSVFLYDSHLRLHITGSVPSGTQVHVQLHQSNPVLDFYYVEADTPSGHQKGWVPAPFLQFSPPHA